MIPILAYPQTPATPSAPEKSRSTANFHTTLSIEQKQHILDGQCLVAASIASIPQTLKDGFAKATDTQHFELANPGQEFQATDVVTRKTASLPIRRLQFAGACGDRWFIHYEHGGFAPSYGVLIFRADSNGTMQFLWGGAGFQGAKSIEELRAAIASGKFADNLEYRW